MRSRRVACRRCRQTLGVTLPKGGVLVHPTVQVLAGDGDGKRLVCPECRAIVSWRGPVSVAHPVM